MFSSIVFQFLGTPKTDFGRQFVTKAKPSMLNFISGFNTKFATGKSQSAYKGKLNKHHLTPQWWGTEIRAQRVL